MQYGYNMAKWIPIYILASGSLLIKPPLAVAIVIAALRIDAVHLFAGRVGSKKCAN